MNELCGGSIAPGIFAPADHLPPVRIRLYTEWATDPVWIKDKSMSLPVVKPQLPS
jgi:hypothetical protein